MKWEKPSAAIIEILEKNLPADQRIEKKKMFGFPCAFVNGNMFCSVFNQSIMVRLSPGQIEHWIKTKKAKRFEPIPGKPMKEYIEPPGQLLKDPGQLSTLILESFEFAQSLKPRLKKKAAAKKAVRSKR